jgi:hypothetical protein
MIYVYSLWRSTKGSNFRDLYVGNAVARSTCTQITLEIDLRGHDCQTHHGEYARLHSLYLGLHHPAVKMFCALALPRWMTGMTVCALAVIFTGFLQCCPDDQSFNSLLADLHHMVHLQAVCTLLLRFSHGQNFVFCLFTNSPSCKWASSLNHRHSEVAEYCCTNCVKSQQKSCLCFVLVLLSICNPWSLWRYKLMFQQMLVCVHLLLILDDWEHCVTSFSQALKQCCMFMNSIILCACWSMPSPILFFLLQTPALNTDFV